MSSSQQQQPQQQQSAMSSQLQQPNIDTARQGQSTTTSTSSQPINGIRTGRSLKLESPNNMDNDARQLRIMTHLLIFIIMITQPTNGLPRTSSYSPSTIDVDPTKVFKVPASDGKTGESKELSYSHLKAVGNGSFGVVFQAKLLDTGELTAIKKVLQDKRFKVDFDVHFNTRK
jgi:hypothetical protein